MTAKQGLGKLFTPVYLDLQCVLFFKTKSPIVPVDFVRTICEDATSQESKKRVRFVNRLTPMTVSAKATEKGLEDVGKRVLREHFQLADKESYVDLEAEKNPFSVSPTKISRCSWMIFQCIRLSSLYWSQRCV
jgi:tRNA acetyltransferase TAN1